MRILKNLVAVSLAALSGILLFISSYSRAMDTNCLPVLDKNKSQYVVVYGRYMLESLRSEALKRKANKQLPVWVSGFKRGWITRISSEGKYTQLGAVPQSGAMLNAVLVRTDADTVNYYDRKEAHNCRTRLDPESVTSMTGQILPTKIEFWIYTTKKGSMYRPSSKYPILLSDVDEFLTGCIEQAKQFNLTNFPEECIESTDYWSRHWVNDRDRPVRGRLVQVNRSKVDDLLEKIKGGLYEDIRSN